MASKKFAQQIRELEEEGAKLLAATHTLGDALHINGRTTQPRTTRAMTPELTALTDITDEQRTISELGKNLDEQCKETARLHRELFNSSSSSAYREPQRSSNLANLDIPVNGQQLTTSSVPPVQSKSYRPVSAAQNRSFSYGDQDLFGRDVRQVTESQREVTDLRSRLKEALSISEQQKIHFRGNIEDLRGQLQVVTIERDSLMQKSKRTKADKDLHIERLQETIEQLERANRLQEETLLEMNEKLQGFQKDQYIIDTAVTQVRVLLQEREHRQGRPFYDNEPIMKQSLTVLVHSVERCLQNLEFELSQRQDRVDQLLLELDEVKSSTERKEDQLVLEQEKQLTRLQEEHDRELLGLTEQCAHYKDQAILLQDKVRTLEKQMGQQMSLREDQMTDLEKRMYNTRQEHDVERRNWADKKSALEMALDESQKEAALMKGDRDSAIRKAAQIESRFNDMQALQDQLNHDLLDEREKLREYSSKEFEARTLEEKYNIQLKHKDHVLADLEKKFKAAQQEADVQIQAAISNMEKEGRAAVQKEISSLKTQVEALTEKCHSLQLELEVTKAEKRNTQEKYDETKCSLTKVTTQYEEASSRKESLSAMLNEKVNDVERVSQEKDYYFKLIEERNQEILTLNTLKEKLSIQLEEREKNFMAIQQQNEKMQSVMGESSRSSTELQLEKQTLQQKCTDKVAEVEELRKLKDQLIKKVKAKEAKIQELEEENRHLSGEVGEKKAETGAVARDKDKLYQELRHSRYEVSALREEKQTLEKRLQEKEGNLGQELTKLSKKLKSTDRELKLAKKALKTREEVDSKAVKVAGKMQREVTDKRGQLDTLQTRIRWLEECLDAAIKDKATIQEENEKLTASIFKLGKQSERLSQELHNHLSKNKQLKDKAAKLETALEKAAVKNASVLAQLEEQQQEMARIQLKHQLQIKEMTRNGNVKKFYSPSPEKSTTAATTNIKSPVYRLPQTYHTGTSGGGTDMEEKPVRDIVTKWNTESSETVNQELKDLLLEMRSLIHSGKHKEALQGNFQPNESTVFSDSELEPRKGSRLRHGKERHKARSNHKTSRKRSESPVSDLLTTSTYEYDCLSDTALSPSILYKADDVPRFSHKPTRASRSTPHGKETQDVCKRLEKKIESLSKIGSQLQQDNKEIAMVMKDQDKKLKKVKSQMAK